MQILVVVANIEMDASGTDIQRPRYFFKPFSKSKDCDEVVEWQETGSKSSKEHEQLSVQLEYCEKGTLRNLIDEGLHEDKEAFYRDRQRPGIHSLSGDAQAPDQYVT